MRAVEVLLEGARMQVVASVGQRIGGEYEVVKPLGSGGMGVVYAARQVSTNAMRALKVMHPSFVKDDTLKRRFEQEARVGALIQSDHVVQVLASGIDEFTGAPWIAMELLHGMDLAQFVHARGALPWNEAIEIVAQIAHALGAGHRAGIVHRDLKLENVFLASSRLRGVGSVVKVLDFGIAKIVSEARVATAAVGTPLCMAPEQAYSSPPVSPRTDVWALGLLVFNLLTGHCFWRSGDADGSPAEVLREVIVDPIPLASERAALYLAAQNLPNGFDAWFARCVVREPDQRFADAEAAWAALHPLFGRTAEAPATETARGTLLYNEKNLAAMIAPTTTTPGGDAPKVDASATTAPKTEQSTGTARVTYRERFGKTIVAAPKGSTILEMSVAHNIPHWHECNGKARCTTCRVVVSEGLENLGARTEPEAIIARKRNWPENMRLACQTTVHGDATVRRLVHDAEDAGIVNAERSTLQLTEREQIVMVCTVRNFDTFAMQNLAYDVAHILQRVVRQIEEPAAANQGKLVRFDGGVAMVLFGTEDRSIVDAALAAVRTALRLQQRMRALNQYIGKQYGNAFELGVAIHAGQILAGGVPVSDTALPVALGEAVDIAHGIEAIARPAHVKIAITEAVQSLVADQIRVGRPLESLARREGNALGLVELIDFSKPDSVYLVQSTLEQVAARADEFGRLFYERLFEIAPQVTPLFDAVDMQVQRTMLMNMLAVTVRGLDHIETLIPTLQDLGRRHVKYGAKPLHYRAVGESLLFALEQFFGDAFTPEVQLAWYEIYGTIARTMIEAARAATPVNAS